MKRLSDQTLYEIIEVSVEALPEEIARACDRAAATYGPGSLVTYTLASTEESALLASRIEEARAVLLDRSARARYDERIGVRPHGPPAPAPPAAPAPFPSPPERREAATTPARWPPIEVEPAPVEPLQISPGLPVVTPAPSVSAEPPAPAAEPPPPAWAPAPLETSSPPPPEPAAPAALVERASSPRSPSPSPSAPSQPVATPAPEVAPPVMASAPPEQAAAVPASAPGGAPPTTGSAAPIVLTRAVSPILLDKEVSPPAPMLVPEGAAWSGELLRRVRESRGLTLQQLAERTRITRHHLENIEQDRFKALPAGVYLRGIIMSLSRELRLDGQKVARSYLDRMGTGNGGEP